MTLNNPRKSPMSIVSGDYTGDGSDGRQITTGFKCSMVITSRADDPRITIMIPGHAYQLAGASGTILAGGTAIHATDGFTLYETADFVNTATKVFKYWAIATA